MKIKEVIEKTKLTDRAIRFYIDNGLVSPGIEENYSGRKNIEFSENDIERLSQIALLRKAGFSISDIKEIISDDEKIKEIVKKFIEESEEEIKRKSEVVEKLKTISFDEKVSLKTLCERLSDTVKENDIPKEDSKGKRMGRVFFKSFGITGMVFSVATIVAILIIIKVNFIHFSFGWEEAKIFLISNAGMFLTFVISSVLLLLNRKKKQIKKMKRVAVSAVLTFIIIPLAFYSSLFSFVTQILTLTESETTSIDDYRDWDIFVRDFEYAEKVDLLFPDKIPPSAKENADREFEKTTPFTTKYYYRHTFCLDPDLDIVATWKLNDTEFKEAIKNAKKVGEYEVRQKGNWTCLYFQDLIDEREGWTDDSYCFIIFAYNNETNMVRYITSYVIDSYDYGPYYLSLDW